MPHSSKRFSRLMVVLSLWAVAVIGAYGSWQRPQTVNESDTSNLAAPAAVSPVTDTLQQLPIKGRAPKTGYSRSQFGNGWLAVNGCSTRELILARDLSNITYGDDVSCKVASGSLNDPYTNKTVPFVRGPATSGDIQIDHVVALSDAWQKGAQQLTPQQRLELANDPLELLAVDGQANQNKSDGDAATWLPPNKAYRCSYIARQIAVKKKYGLWVTRAERDAMVRILNTCPAQTLPAS